VSAGPWNHNIHYHHIVLRAIPPLCRNALDAGCGHGLLARQLALHCEHVTAIDVDHEVFISARTAGGSSPRVTYLQGDVLTHGFPAESFDLITAVATLHHFPLKPALERFQNLLRPGGVLAVIGLYRLHAFSDYVMAAAAFPASWTLRCLKGVTKVGAPVQEPRETLREIRAACDTLFTGGTFKRHLLFRYSFIWRKP